MPTKMIAQYAGFVNPDDFAQDVAAAISNTDDRTGETPVETALATTIATPGSAVRAAVQAAVTSRAGIAADIDDISGYAVRTSLTATTWETPDGSGVIVHPSVLYFPDGFNGYQWWATATPYFNADIALENPCIYVSTDGTDWIEPPGVTNPLVPKPATGYNSDPQLVQAPNGELLLYYRPVIGSNEEIHLIRSWDGITWSEPVSLLSFVTASSRFASPAVWFDPQENQWVMLGVQFIDEPHELWRYTASDPEGPWTFDRIVTVDPIWDGPNVWHIDVQRMGSLIVMLAQEGAGTSGARYFAISRDSGKTFERSTAKVWESNGYKSAFIPVMTATGIAFDCWLGGPSLGFGASRGLATYQTEPTLPLATRLGLAELPAYPYVAGDTFTRADASGLGTAPSGQTWSALTATFNIDSGKVRAAAATNTRATLDAGISDYEISLDIDMVAGAPQAWIMFRYAGSSSYLRFGLNGNSAALQTVNPTVSTIVTQTVTVGSHRLRARCVGDQITIWIDDIEWTTVTESLGETSTIIGLQANSDLVTMDNLLVERIV